MSALSITAVRIHAEIRWDNYEHLVSMVSKERQERIFRLRYDVDRIRSMLGEIIARKCISEVIGLPLKSIEFHTDTYGKPYVNLEKPLSFNWSHSGDWILFAVDSEQVGIDVETVRSMEVMDVARDFFDPQEVAQLEGINTLEQNRRFFTVWTLKESYIKWKGTGLSTPLNSFRFLYNQQKDLVFSNNHGDTCFFKTIDLDSRHYAAVCMSRNYGQEIFIEKIEVDKFINSIW
ncbi:4'-phosphopantetheinyl transferase superfamily protein [Paraliobacillus sp. JSM ZJ581]|uniref:4'-phosphopantetheinyl transferase family protein n=1 Tax=Paraliobacillus sp. JSM ZJ581 TaxID=3342118 RepID=UPI0035A8E8E0